VLIALALPLPGAALEPTGRRDAGEMLSRLRDSAATAVERDAAADGLIALARRPDMARDLGTIILDSATSPDARSRLIAAVARSWDAPGRLYRPLLDLTERNDPALTAAVLPAIAAFRTREAAAVLIRRLSDDQPEEVRRAALASLEAMTGQDTLGPDAGAW